MAEQIYTTALTTLTRVKNRLKIDSSDFDTILNRMINGATDFIEKQCDRKFVSRTYTQEVYSIQPNLQKLFLRQYPVSAISAFEYRAGNISSPNWTSFLTDEYVLEEDGRLGMVHVYGAIPSGPNAVRITYTAGYARDFDNFGTSTHTLPADITELCERMVSREFEKKQSEGKESESFNDSSVDWSNSISDLDKAVLAQHKRMVIAM